MGLPCSHKINQIQREERKIQLTDIYEFWHYNRPHRRPALPPSAPPALLSLSTSEISSLQNPPVLPRKGRPKGSKEVPKQSTTRHPSQFELVDDLAISNKRQRQRLSSPNPSKPPIYEFSAETTALLAEIRSRELQATPDPETDQEEVIPSPVARDNPDPEERAAMELELQQTLKAKNNGQPRPPPLWSTMPEFAGMTKAATTARPTTPRKEVSMDIPVRRSPHKRSHTWRPPPLARKSLTTTRSGRTSKPTERGEEARAISRAKAQAEEALSG
jgi:hypothetical protein